nr:MAG TPA: hypothetical protein [Caudoviricetes sp.]
MCGFNPCRETESYLAKIKLGSKGSSFFYTPFAGGAVST